MSTPLSAISTTKRDFSMIGLNRPTAEQIASNLLILSIKNSISFNKIDSSSFQQFLKFSTSNSFIPDSEVLHYYCLELYNTYQEYFLNYFKINSDFKFSVTFHKWSSPHEIEPFIFIDAHYISRDLKPSLISLGFFEFNEENLINFMVNNYMFKSLPIQFLTTDFELSEKCLQTFNLLHQNDNDSDDKVMFSVPYIIFDCVEVFLKGFAKKIDCSYDTGQNYCINTIDGISFMVHRFFGSIYVKFLKVPLAKIEDFGNFEYIKDPSFKNQKCNTIKYLKGILYFKDELIDDNYLSTFDWEVIEFLVDFLSNFIEIINQCCSQHPVGHLITKLVKILIFQVSKVASTDLVEKFKIQSLVENVVIYLKTYHDVLETKFNLIFATYLHPTTKRFLKTHQISKINQFIDSNSSDQYQQQSENVDDIIAKMFDCSGQNSIECYNYETSSNNNVDGELGPMQFWKLNKHKFPQLARFANNLFSIQANADDSIAEFKNNFHNWRRGGDYDLQAIYFLHKLSNNYDILSFNPKNLKIDFEDVRIEGDTRLTESVVKRRKTNDDEVGSVVT